MKPDYTNVCLITEQAYPLFVALNGPGTPSLGTHKWVFTARIRAWLHLDGTGCLCRYGVITPSTMERLLREADSVCMAGGSTLLSVYNHHLIHVERGAGLFREARADEDARCLLSGSGPPTRAGKSTPVLCCRST